MWTRCRRDKKVPKVWSGENNMDPMAVPEILSNMSDAEQMLIARLAPTVHVHLLKHGGIAWKGHCIAFPQAMQEPATIPPRLPTEMDIIRVRGQGKDDTHKDFRVRRHRVGGALRFADHPQEPVFEEDEEDYAVEAEQQPEWVDVYAGQNLRYEGVKKGFDYDDGGED